MALDAVPPSPDKPEPTLEPASGFAVPEGLLLGPIPLTLGVLERWLHRTKRLPPEAAAAIAVALYPAEELTTPYVTTAPSSIAGLGLFARHDFVTNDVIIVSRLLRIPARVIDAFDDTTVYGHCFELGDDLYGYPTGLATLLNHTAEPNARCEIDADADELCVYATSAIAAGEEILIDYTAGDPEHDLWFDPGS